MADVWTTVNGGQTPYYCAPSGMIGGINSAGFWCMFVPAEGMTYQSSYGGAVHTVVNIGGGKYAYALGNSGQSIHQYARRWFSAQFFDALGNPVGSFDAARASGEPGSIYFDLGLPGDSAVQLTQQQQQTAAPESWTRSSDGRRDIWAGASGMVGVRDGDGKWIVFQPVAGLTVESYYGGSTIRVQNVGDGSYQLTIDGASSRRAYPPQWMTGEYFGADGRALASPSSLKPAGDPVAFMNPGAVFNSQTAPSVAPNVAPNVAPTVAPNVPTVPTGPNTVPSVSAPFTSGGGGGGGVTIAPFPTGDDSAPAPVAPESKSGLAVAAAIAAALLFS